MNLFSFFLFSLSLLDLNADPDPGGKLNTDPYLQLWLRGVNLESSTLRFVWQCFIENLL